MLKVGVPGFTQVPQLLVYNQQLNTADQPHGVTRAADFIYPQSKRHIHAAERNPAISAQSAAGTAQRLSLTPAAVKYTAMT